MEIQHSHASVHDCDGNHALCTEYIYTCSSVNGLYGVGECSAFPMIVGETQATCFEMAKEFAAFGKKKMRTNNQRLGELHDFTAFNTTIKSAFDMALYDMAQK